MKARWLWFLLALFLLVVALAWQAPAWLAASLLAEASQGRFNLEETQGSLWSGRGRLVMNTPQASLVLIDSLAWQTDPRGLLEARVRLRLEIANQPAGELSFWREGVAAEELKFTLPAAVLVALPQLAQAQPSGVLAVDIPSLVWATSDSRGQGRVLWQHASLQVAGSHTRWRGEVAVELAARENLLSLATAAGSPLPWRLDLRRSERGIDARLATPQP